jgi:hypothetical protein
LVAVTHGCVDKSNLAHLTSGVMKIVQAVQTVQNVQAVRSWPGFEQICDRCSLPLTTWLPVGVLMLP